MKKTVTVLFALLVITAPLFGASPPDLMNFQGVLRNATDAPQNGTFDMVFRFFSASVGGDEILVDSHTAAGGSPVTVTKGLFNTQLGAGSVADGSGPSAYTTLTAAFRDYSDVFVQIQVGAEILSPRIQVVSAGHALNAEHADLLDGLNSGNASGNIPVSNGTLNTNLNADLLDGLDSAAFAAAGHLHQTLTAGTGLGGGTYDGGTASTFSVTYGTAADTAVQGDQAATVTAGNGLTGGVSADALGDGFSATVNVGAGNGIGVSADSIALGNLTAAWNQSGAFNITLNHADSELSMRASDGANLFGTLDVGVLSTNQTYTFSGANGTVWTTGNDGAASGLDADQLDSKDSTQFLRSDTSDNYTSGTLTLDAGTTFSVNGTFRVGPLSSTDIDSIFFDDGSSEAFRWNDFTGGFQLTDSLEVGPEIYITDSTADPGRIRGFSGVSLRIESFSHPTIATSDHNLELYAAGNIVGFALDTDNDESDSGSTFAWMSNGLAASNKIMELSSNTGNLYISGVFVPNTAFDLAETFQRGEPMEAGDLVRVSPNSPKEVLLTQDAGDPTVLGVVSAKPGVVLGGGAFSEKGLREVWGDQVANQYLSKREQLKSEVLGKSNDLQERKKHLDSFHPASLSAIDEGGEDGKKQLQDHHEMAAQYESDLEVESLGVFFERHFAPIALSGRTPVKVDTQFGEIKIGDELGPSSIPGVAMKLTTAGPTIGTAMENFSGGRGMVLTFVHRGWYAPAGGGETQTAVQNEIKKPIATEVATTNGNLQVMLDRDADDESRFSVSKDSKGVIADEVFRVDEMVEVGDVLAADRTRPGIMRKANTAYDPAVVGIVSPRTGELMGSSEMSAADSQLAAHFELARSRGDRKEAARVLEQLQTQFDRTHAPIAPSGRVAVCKVDAAYGGIEVGNLLVASPTSGHAMRSDNPLPGTVIGKALEPLASGAGLIRVLVMLR